MNGWRFTEHHAILECITIPSYTAKMERERRQRAAMRAIGHGHDWGRERQCACGMRQIEYHALHPDSHEMCPRYVEMRT